MLTMHAAYNNTYGYCFDDGRQNLKSASGRSQSIVAIEIPAWLGALKKESERRLYYEL